VLDLEFKWQDLSKEALRGEVVDLAELPALSSS
jgi:hypothetical protein